MSGQLPSKQQLIIDELRRRARKKTGSYTIYEPDTAWVAVDWIVDEQTSRDAWMKRATEAEAEIERLNADFEQQVKRGDILNAELSGFMKAATKREADQSAEIERLTAELASLKDAFNDRVRIIEIQLKDKDRLRAALVRTKDAAWDCRGALRRFEMSVREQVRNGGMTQATRTELARAADRADESEKSAMKALDAVRVTDERHSDAE